MGNSDEMCKLTAASKDFQSAVHESLATGENCTHRLVVKVQNGKVATVQRLLDQIYSDKGLTE